MRGPNKQTNDKRVVLVQSIKDDRWEGRGVVFSKIVARKTGKWSELFKMAAALKSGYTMNVKDSEDAEWAGFASACGGPSGWSDDVFKLGSRRVFLQLKNNHQDNATRDYIDEFPDVVITLH